VSQEQKSGGESVQLILFVILSIIVILFFGLSNIENDSDFKGLIVFSMLYFFSFYGLLFISVTKFGDRIAGKNARLFFFHPVTFRDIIFYVPLGIGGAFLFSMIAGFSGLDPISGRIFAIAGAGFVFSFILWHKKSVLLLILAHGLFNSIVLMMRANASTAEILSSNPFPVPEIGITIGSLNVLASEALFNVLIVAPAEEFFRLIVMTFVFLSVKGKVEKKPIVVYVIAVIFAVAMWAVFHLIRGGSTA